MKKIIIVIIAILCSTSATKAQNVYDEEGGGSKQFGKAILQTKQEKKNEAEFEKLDVEMWRFAEC